MMALVQQGQVESQPLELQIRQCKIYCLMTSFLHCMDT